MRVCVACLYGTKNYGKVKLRVYIRTGLSASHMSLWVSKTSMSISAVFPWCKWPTIATFRIISGNAVIFSRKLRKRSERDVYKRMLDSTPFVKPRFGHVFFFYCPLPNFDWSNYGFGERLGIFFLNQRLYPRPIDIFRWRVVLFIFVKNDSLMWRFFVDVRNILCYL